MDMDNLVVLQEILKVCVHDREEEKEKLQNNLNKISEIDLFMKSIKEEADLKFFSPRSPENIFGDKIEEKKIEKENFEKENQNHYLKINELDKQIDKLQLLIEKEKAESGRHFKILDIQEKERQRIARELHDSSVQNLTHLIHSIELGFMFIDQDPIRAKLELESCINNLRLTINEIRDTIFNLRPMSFDDLGFARCIDDFLSNSKKEYHSCYIEHDVCELDKCNWKTNDNYSINLFLVTVYRIIQEGIMNALKYSHAEKITLKISNDNNQCYILIQDNGKGFSFDKVTEQYDRHFGIPIMQERVNLLDGRMNITSEPGNGTKLEIVIPLI